jgi:hypothetical protein
MKGLIVAAVAALGLAGCVAVPYGGDPYYGGPAYYPAPTVSFGVGIHGGHGHHRHHHHRHYRRW